MAQVLNQLPHLQGDCYLTDGGMETSLIYQQGIDLPEFAAFVLLQTSAGREALRAYYQPYLALAKNFKKGFVLETPTWRANSSCGAKLGYSEQELKDINQTAVGFVSELKQTNGVHRKPVLISGCIGPMGDGYVANETLTVEQAADFHQLQVRAFHNSGANFVTAHTLTNSTEGIGVTLAAKSLGMPVVIGFTVETNGLLPSGESLRAVIEKVDEFTNNYPLYYMINCAHPTHFIHCFNEGDSWQNRIRAVRANASDKSHAELDCSHHLEEGDPEDLAWRYQQLKPYLKHLCVVGGCCGTDERHVEAITIALSE